MWDTAVARVLRRVARCGALMRSLEGVAAVRWWRAQAQ